MGDMGEIAGRNQVGTRWEPGRNWCWFFDGPSGGNTRQKAALFWAGTWALCEFRRELHLLNINPEFLDVSI